MDNKKGPLFKIYWECSYCKYRITDAQHTYARFDYLCRCGKPISSYHEVKEEVRKDDPGIPQ
jgi:hypothetical protein